MTVPTRCADYSDSPMPDVQSPMSKVQCPMSKVQCPEARYRLYLLEGDTNLSCRSWTAATGTITTKGSRQTLDFGLWTLDFGLWTLDFGLLHRFEYFA